MSAGKRIDAVIETVKLIGDALSRYKLSIMDFNIEQIAEGLTIYKDLRRGFFDSLMAGAALAHDRVIIGDDEAFLNIPNLKRETLKQYLEELKER